MPNVSHIHSQTEWLKNRLDEMDASVGHFEANVEKTTSVARSKAVDAVADMKKRRDAFKHWFDQKEDQGEQTWHETKAKLEKEWEGFEDSVEGFIENIEDKAGASANAFKARAASQRQSWEHTIERAKSASRSFQENRKTDVTKAITRLESEADKVGDILKGVNQAGHESWSALRKALSESRGAFDQAVDETKTAFIIAAKITSAT